MAGATTDAELDPALVAAFGRDGFVVVPDLLDRRRARPSRPRRRCRRGPEEGR